MSDYSWQLIEDRKILKQQIIRESNGERKEVLDVQYRDMRQKIKKSAHRDKRKWSEYLVDKAEKEKEMNDSHTVYKITRMLSGKLSAKTRPIKDINGKLFVTAEGQLNRQNNFFELILNSDYEEETELEFGKQVMEESLSSRITADQRLYY
jgi:uncharacterized protein with von Willebrand factor type A (vWA) domain